MASLADQLRRLLKADDLYRRDAANDPEDIRALIEQHILPKLVAGQKPPKAGSEYLADALQKILRGVPAQRAMLLSRPAGRPARSARNQQVFDGIERLRKRGGQLQDAIRKVATRNKMTFRAAKRIYYRYKNK